MLAVVTVELKTLSLKKDADGNEAEGAEDACHTLTRLPSGPHGPFLHWTVSIQCGPGMEQERKEDAQHFKAIFHEAVQSAYGRSRSSVISQQPLTRWTIQSSCHV